MARGKKRKGKREHRRGYGAVNPNGGTGIDYSEDIAAVNGDNGANDHTEEKGDELSVPLDEVCTARALNDVDDEDDSDESTQGECMDLQSPISSIVMDLEPAELLSSSIDFNTNELRGRWKYVGFHASDIEEGRRIRKTGEKKYSIGMRGSNMILLGLICFLPFGGHFIKSSFSSLEVYFLADRNLGMTSTSYGALLSAVTFPNLIMPFLGSWVDAVQGQSAEMWHFLTLAVIGYLVVVISVTREFLPGAYLGQLILGVGSGTVTVAHRAVISRYFHQRQLTFALGVSVAVAALSKMLSKATVAPVAEYFGTYKASLVYIAFFQGLSWFAAIVYARWKPFAESGTDVWDTHTPHLKFNVKAIKLTFQRSSLAFWIVSLLHVGFMSVYHLFGNVSGHYLVQEYNLSPVKAGYVSSIMPFTPVVLAPLVGLTVDRLGGKLYVLLAAGLVTLLSYFILESHISKLPVISIVMLSVCESFSATILLSLVSDTVDNRVYGVAFGIFEASLALGLFVGNIMMGVQRDAHSSYNENINAVMLCCCVCITASVVLIIEDGITGLKLNQPHPVDFDKVAQLSQGSMGISGSEGNKEEEELLKQDKNSSPG